jgi:osmotically inducible protein OsmC
MLRTATATWTGSPAIGEGAVTTTSGIMSNTLYSFGSSSGNEPCTSPSEMLAAAVAACVSLLVAQEMAKAHLKYEQVKTEAVLILLEKHGCWDISGIELEISTHLPQRDAGKFQKCAKVAQARCPISRALKVPIKMVRQTGIGSTRVCIGAVRRDRAGKSRR